MNLVVDTVQSKRLPSVNINNNNCLKAFDIMLNSQKTYSMPQKTSNDKLTCPQKLQIDLIDFGKSLRCGWNNI